MPSDDLRFPPTARLRAAADFRRVYGRGERISVPSFVIVIAQGERSESRLGLSVGKRVGGAVVRNRIKRLVREYFRRNRSRFSAPRDIIVIAKKNAAEADFKSAARQLEAMFEC